ncbi:hypothetical protein LYSHEL_22980 [Lysobacter helvus]|uniref:AbiEii toxin of type IV toxin-antitoxin system n=2 Tax=Lysobacteraceae TaxID=32033 RepID=A0ABN6FU66_9GAMM|nr:hypothetical protein LYSCAS_22980 [Lysobacter caseinilyticus]BCT96427.1 hypothetical protein LYSHEL_22980 [Lysobacter helvus]
MRVRAPGTEVLYSASEMSDGERAIFYLTGQVLVAEQGALLVVDEPELHVHPSIMNKLWDQLENARPDCAFAFITHDLEFAAARVGQKFIIREYSAGPRWKLEAMPVDAGFPEEITTLLLGSRRPILFVEGDGGSLDQSVYRCVYPEWTVVPMGSCQDVIRAVATMRTNAAFTRLRCAGIVDADDYDVTEIERLTELGVSVLPVSELENVFLLPNISREIARAEHLDDTEIEARLGELRTELLTIAAQPESIDAVVRRHTVRRIDRLVKRIDVSRERSIDQIDSEFRAQAHALNIHGLAEDRRRGINAAIAAQDLPALLALLDNKGLIARAASRLRSTRLDSFESWLARILLNDRAPALVAALRAALPRLSSA